MTPTIFRRSLILVFFFVSVSCSTLTRPTLKSPEFRPPGAPLSAKLPTDTEVPPPGDDRILLSWPVRGEVRFSRGFMLGVRPHQGIDLAAPRGTPVLASHDGYVEYAGKDFSGYGKLVIINSGAGWATFYAHLNRIRVTEKSRIRRGQRIGDMGATGRATGVHLHFELRYNERPVDPLDYLPPL